MMAATGPVQNAFRALADPTRRSIVGLLSQNEMTIAEVADRFEMTRPAVKKHLRVLEEGNIISVRAEGRERINRLEPAGLKRAADWLDHFSHFWDERLAALREAAEAEEKRHAKRND